MAMYVWTAGMIVLMVMIMIKLIMKGTMINHSAGTGDDNDELLTKILTINGGD